MSHPRASEQKFAIYTRTSSEMQNDISLAAQEARCRQAVAERGGSVVQVFSDSAQSGWSLEREGFLQLCRAAEQGRFDALMLWQFDRLARNHNHAVAIKTLLRLEFGLKLNCVSGFSEDDSDSAEAAMMEQMLAVFSAFYSRNLSSETKRGKRQRALNGEFNGSVAPLGYMLVTRAQATAVQSAGLTIHPRLAAIVRRAFRRYATGRYSDAQIAHWLNGRKEIQKLRAGKKPVGKEMVRDMLQNRVYTGRVPYAETVYSQTLGTGKQSSRKRKQWFEGKHVGFISDDLFDACQEVRKTLVKTKQSLGTVRLYLLHDRVYCARCLSVKPDNLHDANYGKMRPRWDHRRNGGSYRCLARDRGYRQCEQGYVPVCLVDDSVVAALSGLSIPKGFQERVETAVQQNVAHADAVRRMAVLEDMVKRIDFSWEQGYLSPEAYVAKRQQLKQEIAALRPAEVDNFMVAADLLENFYSFWQEYENVEDPIEARQQLLAQIVERVYVYDQTVVTVHLHGGFCIELDE